MLQNREIKAIKPQCTLMKIIVLSCFPIWASSFKEKQTARQEAFQSIQWMLHHLLKVSPWRELQNRSVSAWAHSPAAQGQFAHPFLTSWGSHHAPAQWKTAQQPGCAIAREQIQSREQPTQLVRHIMSVKLVPTHTAGWWKPHLWNKILTAFWGIHS